MATKKENFNDSVIIRETAIQLVTELFYLNDRGKLGGNFVIADFINDFFTEKEMSTTNGRIKFLVILRALRMKPSSDKVVQVLLGLFEHIKGIRGKMTPKTVSRYLKEAEATKDEIAMIPLRKDLRRKVKKGAKNIKRP